MMTDMHGRGAGGGGGGGGVRYSLDRQFDSLAILRGLVFELYNYIIN